MHIWPFVPGAAMIETLEWRTDIIRTKTGEQRIALRTIPRQSWDFTHYFQARQFSRARAEVYTAGVDDIGVPVWIERSEINHVFAGAKEILCETQHARYRPEGKALIWQSDDNYEVLDIADAQPGKLQLNQPIKNSFTDALIMPLCICRMPQGGTFSRAPAEETTARIIMVSVETPSAPVSLSPYPLYRTLDVMMDPSAISRPLEEQIQHNTEVLDNELGLPYYATITRQPAQRFSIAWQCFTAEALWKLKCWIYSRYGRQKAFWLPTWAHDFELVAPVAAQSTEIEIRSTGYSNTYLTHPENRNIMIRNHHGTVFFREIKNARIENTKEILTLNKPLNHSLPLSDLDRISLIHCVRFAADRIEIQHQNGIGAFINVPCEEVPQWVI